jgi:DNA-binding transcriptional LysR family regulator
MELPDFNLRHLRALLAIVQVGSVSAAARSINLTQPAITQAIGKLEAQLGTKLFDRVPGGMTPTEAGLILATRAATILRLIGSRRVTSPQMRAFLALARSGSYAHAAKALGVREPSLHRAIGDLSLNIGQKLVERRGRGVALTPRGLATARQFRLAQSEIRSALAELENLRGREVGRIVIGAMPLCRAQLLPAAISEFHQRFPEVELGVLEGSHTELVGPLRDGEVDLMIGALRGEVGPDLNQQSLFVDRPVVLGRAEHPLAKLGNAPTVDDLALYPWIVPSAPTPLRTQWESVFRNRGLTPPKVAIECGSVIVIRQLLVRDDYLTILSPAQVAVELEAGWLKQIWSPPSEVARTIGITTRMEWQPTQLQQEFIAVVERQAKELAVDA